MLMNIYIYIYGSLIIKLVMVAVGIDFALVMFALVLNRTACRRPGMRDDPAYLDGDMRLR